ncbi:hypothetical protein CHS0354_041901 [Potamilus streckersoni]|uniref:AIG1-type G domain-containing protein n=1 Tax=Potamilus streckersoni TaxID=2493646 RepID=A0AAE0W1B2_9BIVA|nr:hypothetical protein CHS0354_041901 [Potamilus streckersoni]
METGIWTDLNILLFGNDKVGKTSIGNLILNYVGLANANFRNETGDPVCNSAITEDFPGKLITVIDTPGFGRYRRRVTEAIKQKKDEFSSRSGAFSVLFIVRANRVSDRECSESIQSFEEVFGRQFSGRTIVVVTHSNEVRGNIDVENFVGSCGTQLKNFIRKHKLRVYFADIFTTNSDFRKLQVKNLISMIESEDNTESWSFLSLSAAAAAATTAVVAGIALVAIYVAKQ